MKHYTFTASVTGILAAMEHMSYCLFTKPDDDGWVRGYAQGAYVPLDLTTKTGDAPSGAMRRVIHELDARTMEVGDYVSMGVCGSCDTRASSTWSPHLCERCLLLLS